jgi:hypothetical protein
MRTIITYITDDGKEFDNQFIAKKHECELTSHDWDFYNENLGLQKEQDEHTHMLFCKKCSTQKLLR